MMILFGGIYKNRVQVIPFPGNPGLAINPLFATTDFPHRANDTLTLNPFRGTDTSVKYNNRTIFDSE